MYNVLYCLLPHVLHADWALFEPAVTRRSSSNSNTSNGYSNSSNRYSSVCGYQLRSKRLYPHTWMYIAAAAVNLVLRFCWTVTIVPESVRQDSSAGSSYLFSKDFQMYMSPFVAAAEIVRRSLWGLLRVEAEHIALFCTDTTTANSGTSNGTANGIHSSGSSSSATIDFEQGLADQPYTKMHTTTRAAEYRSSSSGSSWQHSSSWLQQLLPVWYKEALQRSGSRLLPELVLYTVLMAAVGYFASHDPQASHV
jgi:EXS family